MTLLTKKEIKRYDELYQKAIDNYLDKTDFDACFCLPPKEAEELDKLMRKANGGGKNGGGLAKALVGKVAKKEMSREELLGALVRGYCSTRNSEKNTDYELIEDMASEIEKLGLPAKVCPVCKGRALVATNPIVSLCKACGGTGKQQFYL
jgi:hypothetical protein